MSVLLFGAESKAGSDHGPARTGIVVSDGRAVRDDQGGFHPKGLTFFWAMQRWLSDRPRMKQNAEWVASKGFDYVRILTEVQWANGLKIDPTTSKWSNGIWGRVLRDVIDYFYDELGVRVQPTLIGKGTATDPMWLAREAATIIGENRQHKILLVECCNEYTITDVAVPLDRLVPMARELRDRTPNLIALSAPGDWGAMMNESLKLGVDGFTVHLDRGAGDYGWRQVRQSYDLKDARPFVTFSNEPAGPGSSVATNTNPLQLAMMRAVGVMCGGTGFVLHTGTGVFGDGVGHPTAGPRPANFWEIDNIDAIVDAVNGINKLLPEGVENWRVIISRNTNSGEGRDAPFTPHDHWEGSERDGVNKAYSALSSDGRWIQMPCGVRGHVVLTASYPLSDVTVYDPLTGRPLPGFENRSFAQGETLDLPGGGEDAMVAYVIQGRR